MQTIKERAKALVIAWEAAGCADATETQAMKDFLTELANAPEQEPPADLVRDAERYRTLVKRSHYGDGPLYLVEKAPDKWVFGERIGSILDAVIERDKLKGQS